MASLTTYCQMHRFAKHIIVWFDICHVRDLPSTNNYVCMQLKLLVRDSKQDSSQTLAQVHDLVPVHNCIAIIGPTSSTPTKDVSMWLSKMPEKHNRVMIGYSATSTELSGTEFANFVRTPPADDAVATQMASSMKGSLEVGQACTILRIIRELRMIGVI